MDEPMLDEDLSEKDLKPISLFALKILAISAFLVCVALLFRLSQWPGSALMLMVGSGLASGHAIFRVIKLVNTPVERAMRLFIPILATSILFFWMQFTLVAFWFFLAAAIVDASIDHVALKKRL